MVVSYASALENYEAKIGRPITGSFSIPHSDNSVTEKLELIKLFNQWKSSFEALATTADCLPLAVKTPSDYLLKRSILYSANIAVPIRSGSWMSFTAFCIPDSYVNFCATITISSAKMRFAS